METNILLNKLPQTTPTGKSIRTDFRECIKFELLMQDPQIDDMNKIKLALNLFYYEIPQNIEEAINEILWFYSGEEIKKTSQKNGNEKQNQIYSYEFDADYIYTAFMQQYKIDLNSVKYLHWWKFKALFKGLTENTKIVEIMGYRAVDLNKIKDKEERKRYKQLKKTYALPDMRTEQQKEADFGMAFWG